MYCHYYRTEDMEDVAYNTKICDKKWDDQWDVF